MSCARRAYTIHKHVNRSCVFRCMICNIPEAYVRLKFARCLSPVTSLTGNCTVLRWFLADITSTERTTHFSAVDVTHVDPRRGWSRCFAGACRHVYTCDSGRKCTLGGQNVSFSNYCNPRIAVTREPRVEWAARDPATGLIWCTIRGLREDSAPERNFFVSLGIFKKKW